MSNHFEKSALWKATLADQGAETFSREKEQLRNAFFQFRKNVNVLVERIANTLPGLTKHDISHLDALWETATLIAGETYPLNPLEGFVFGGAILLHDAALCFEAFSGGIDEIRNTVVWKDAHAAELAARPNETREQIESHADFSALRILHARQADRLAETSWKDPDTHQSLYLIEDSSLRKHLGPLIGRIASSHHWEIEFVESEFKNQINAISPFPREWRIDPLKLACLLRCADAAHIDQDRAPDFLHALLKRQGISFDHWQAQNRIGRADLDILDPTGSTLILTSTRPFRLTDAASWWVAYDAACLIDKEIRTSNSVLESHKAGIVSNSFRVKRVKGVDSPERMAEFFQAEGWKPCSAMLHVGNVEGLINALGGEVLYGKGVDTLQIVIRELIQNARDAIHARRAFDPEFEGFVRVTIERDSEGTNLVVEDDGIGMSRRVLTGPLLDFGSSFWTSSLVREEFPGLRSSKFRAVGQFGIGFYSVFMTATDVRVASRRWDQGQDAVIQLVFDNGLTLRPLLIGGRPSDLRSDVSTQIKLRLKPDVIAPNAHIEIKRNVMGATNFPVAFSDYIAALCAGIDVKVLYRDESGSEMEIHSSHPPAEQSRESWVQTISFSKYQDPSVANYLHEHYQRMRPIIEDGECFGLAAISTRHAAAQDFLNVGTVGGFATNVHNRGHGNYIGNIDYKPKSAKRDQGEFAASSSAMKNWAEEQLRILMQTKLSPLDQCIAATGLTHFGVDPSVIMRVGVTFDGNTFLLNLHELTGLLERMDLAILKPSVSEWADMHSNTIQLPNRALIRVLAGGSFYSLTMESGVPKESNSLFGCLQRALVASGKSPRWSVEKAVAPSPLFGMLDAVVVSIKPAQ